MVGASKILTVSYGTFSCTLEGFDEPFSTMKAIAEYFRDLAADDRYFGAEPPTPDAEMLHRIAEREIQRRVEAKISEHGIVLRPQADAAPMEKAPATETATAALLSGAATTRGEEEPVSAPEPAPVETAVNQPEVEAEPADIEDVSDSVAAKLMRIRAVVSAAQSAPKAEMTKFEDDEPTQEFGVATSVPADDFGFELELDELSPKRMSETEAEDAAPEELEEGTEVQQAEEADEADLPNEDVLIEEPEVSEAVAERDESEIDHIFASDGMTEEETSDETEISAYVDEAEEDFGTEATFVDDTETVLEEEDEIEAVAEIEADLEPVAEHADTDDEDVLEAVAFDEEEGELVGAIDSDAEDYADIEELAHLEDKVVAEAEETISEAEVEPVAEDEAFSDEDAVSEVRAALAADYAMQIDEEDSSDEAETTEEEPLILSDAEDEPEEKPAALDLSAWRMDPPAEEAEAEEFETETDDQFAAEADFDEDDTSEEALETEELRSARVIKIRKADPIEEQADEVAEQDDDTVADVSDELEVEEADRRDAIFAALNEDDEAISDDVAEDENDDELMAGIGAVLGDTGLDPEAEEDLMRELAEVARDARRDGHDGRTILEHSSEDSEASVERLMEEAKSKLEGDENRRRFSAISHLKAAVIATVADRKMKSKDAPAPEETDPRAELDRYRDDLSKAVRPRRPAAEGTSAPTTRRPTIETRAAPLVLVSEQRIDAPTEARNDNVVVRPRRIRTGNLAAEDLELTEETTVETVSPEDAKNFADFAEKLGASGLPELLEAAAAYTATVEGRPHFSRPQILKKVANVAEEDEFSREDSLRSFGMLLRQGKIQKISRGQFTISDASKFMTEARRAAH